MLKMVLQATESRGVLNQRNASGLRFLKERCEYVRFDLAMDGKREVQDPHFITLYISL